MLSREDAEEKHFLIYDVRRNSYIRKVQKNVMSDEAFALDSTGRFLVYTEGGELIVKLIRLPSSQTLVEMLRPRY